VMATKLFGDDNPNLFGNLGESLFTLFTVMTLEGWVKRSLDTHHKESASFPSQAALQGS
jgi:hypothetical protein